MRLAVISFTEQGNRWNEILTKKFSKRGEDCTGYVMHRFFNPYHEQAGLLPMKDSLEEWTGRQFSEADGIVFIGAAGIAVRAAAPFVKDKMTDPAVVVMDELGRFSIALLSGHVGGANELARQVSRMTGAVLVVTTATDINGKFAADNFAAMLGLKIMERETAKRISADVLEGVPVGFFSDYPVEGSIPPGFTGKEICRRSLWITCRNRVEDEVSFRMFLPEDTEVLRLVPKTLIVGIGCRKGVPAEVIQSRVESVFSEANLTPFGIAAVASIDLKKEEPGLKAYAGKLGVDFYTYSAQELEQMPGKYTDSEFVTETTGTGNVCERAAMMTLRDTGGRLLVKKQAGNGVTVAVAEKDWKVKI